MGLRAESWGCPWIAAGFLETSALLTGGALLRRIADLFTADPPMIGIQSGAVSFVDA
jgi:ABC-type Fe3+-siderophore transport system permease subunit